MPIYALYALSGSSPTPGGITLAGRGRPVAGHFTRYSG